VSPFRRVPGSCHSSRNTGEPRGEWSRLGSVRQGSRGREAAGSDGRRRCFRPCGGSPGEPASSGTRSDCAGAWSGRDRASCFEPGRCWPRWGSPLARGYWPAIRFRVASARLQYSRRWTRSRFSVLKKLSMGAL
jgi:hypothetical protein